MYIKAKVQPNSKKELFEKITEDTFAISVREKAIQNRANKRVIELFSNHFNLPVGSVRMVSGHRSPSKIITIEI